MNEFTIGDLIKGVENKTKLNFTGEYIPEHFWDEYGKFYIETFENGKIDDPQNMKSPVLNVPALLARVRDIKPKTVLEVGCGFGRILPYILSHVPSVEKIVGIEISQSMLDAAKGYFRDYAFMDKITLIKGKAQALPFKDKEFDLTYTHVCLTHIPAEDIPQVCKEISRVTKNWIIHIERFYYLWEHPNQHRWSHNLVPYYLDLGWKLWEGEIANKEHYTKIWVLRR